MPTEINQLYCQSSRAKRGGGGFTANTSPSHKTPAHKPGCVQERCRDKVESARLDKLVKLCSEGVEACLTSPGGRLCRRAFRLEDSQASAMLRTASLCLLWASCLFAAPLNIPKQKLLLISFDGFRWDYDRDVHTPYLDMMARDGVKAQYVTPPYISITSPAHFTLLTGKVFSFSTAALPVGRGSAYHSRNRKPLRVQFGGGRSHGKKGISCN